MAVVRHLARGRPSERTAPARDPARVPPAADAVAQLAATRRRRARARSARRGLPRARLLGRAVRVPVPQPADARLIARAAAATATGGSTLRAGPRARPGYRGAMFPWQSGSDGREETAASCTSTRGSGRWIPRQHAPAAARQRRDRLQRLAVLPGHRRPEFLAGYGAEMVLEIARFWPASPRYDRATRPLRDPRRDGPGRVPRRAIRARDAGPRQQRLHERHGGLGALPCARRPRAAAGRTGARAVRAARAHATRRSSAWERHQPQDAPRRSTTTGSSASSRATSSSRSSTGTATARATATSAGSI